MEETFMISQLMIQPNNMMKLEKISTGQGDDYTTGCLLDFAYFKNNYRLIAADLSKQKALDADRRELNKFFY